MNLKVLTIGYDGSIIDKNSKLAKRSIEYGGLVEKYAVVAPANKDIQISLSNNVIGVGVKSLNAPFAMSRLFSLFQIYKKADELIRKENYNVISVQDPFELGAVAFFLSKKFKIGLNIQEHGDFFSQTYWRNENVINFIRFYLGKWLIKKADSVRVVSKRIKNNLVNNLNIANSKIVNVPIYTDVKVGNQGSGIDNQNNEFTFLWIGRFVKQKNLPLLVRAFSEVAKNNGDARLRLVGKGPEKENIVNLINELNLTEKMEVLDWVENVAEQYLNADCYVLSSNYEGWGLVAIESIAYDLPIIMTDTGCAREVIKDRYNGLVVSVNSQKELERAMAEIIVKNSLLDKLKENCETSLNSLLNKAETLNLYLKSWEKAIKN